MSEAVVTDPYEVSVVHSYLAKGMTGASTSGVRPARPSPRAWPS